MIKGFDCSDLDNINWDAISPDFEFFYVKKSEGATFTSKTFQYRYDKLQGQPFGLYHYYRPAHTPQENAQNFLSGNIDWSNQLPPCLDAEEEGITPAMVSEFIQIVSAATGRKMMLYSYPSFLTDNLKGQDFDAYYWIAAYQEEPPSHTWSIWQVSEHGQQNGSLTGGQLDINYFDGDLEKLKSL